MSLISKLVPTIEVLKQAGYGMTASINYVDIQSNLYNSENKTIADLIGFDQLNALVNNNSPTTNQAEILSILRSICILDAISNSNYTASIKRSTLGNQMFGSEKGLPVFSEMTENLILEQKANLQTTIEILLKKLDNYCQLPENEFPLYKEQKYSERKGLFVWNETIYSRFADISNSVYFYYRILPIMREVQQGLVNILGEQFLKDLESKLLQGSGFEAFNANEKVLLNKYLVKFIVYQTHKSALIEQALKVDHKGVVVYNTNSAQETGGNSYQFMQEISEEVARIFDLKSKSALGDLESYLKKNANLFPNYTPPTIIITSVNPKNTDSPTFWV